MKRGTTTAILFTLLSAAPLTAQQPGAPAKAPGPKADTVTIPADYVKGEKAEYHVTFKVTEHSPKGDKPAQVSFPVTVEALEADKDHVVLSWTAKPPATAAITLGVRADFGGTLILLNGFTPRMSVNASDGGATLTNLADAKAAAPRIVEGLASLEKRAGLTDKEVETFKRLTEPTLVDDADIEAIPDTLTQLWYTPMYVSGPTGPGTPEEFENTMAPGITAKGTRTTTFARTASGGAKMVIDGAVDATALPDLVVQMLQRSGTKLTEADIARIKADRAQQIRCTSEFVTDRRGWLVRTKMVTTNRLAGKGKTLESTVERKGEVKPPAPPAAK